MYIFIGLDVFVADSRYISKNENSEIENLSYELIKWKTKEEYALARTERKSGKGYKGFICEFGQNVSLEEDLSRRDLTINAIAQTDDGDLIDPYNGLDDIRNKQLRHVSEAFREDPLRVLRVARFAARYRHLGFDVAPETRALMSEIVAADELSHLSTERIWVETDKALTTQNPEVYWQTLKDCGALTVLLPELQVSQGINALARAARFTTRPDCRWAALLADLSGERAQLASERFKAPNAFSALAHKVAE